ncbi:hypothetical protein [uncultured Oscillibacter sp.]|uniref:hypothetical protein n=1 Tax=uncultured Oscillibacter sp. TaxID=876091 RepID=UPI00260C3331|nr:hypothetical protein [uncultured Oscillibacter sp.]
MKRIVSLLLAIILVVPMGLTNAFALDSKATEHGEIALATVQLSKDTNDDSISPHTQPIELSFGMDWLDSNKHSFRFYVKYSGPLAAEEALNVLNVKLHYYSSGWKETSWIKLGPIAFGQTKSTTFPIPAPYTSAYVEVEAGKTSATTERFTANIK